jgi:hypothetical protein
MLLSIRSNLVDGSRLFGYTIAHVHLIDHGTP